MRIRPLLAAGGISVAVIGAVVFALWSYGSSAVARDEFSTLAYVPKDAQLYVALNTEPASEQWIAFSGILDKLELRDPARDAWDEALAEHDLRWDKDIVSLLGDEAFVAVTDYSTLDETSGAVAVFQLRNTDRARELFLERAPEALEDNGNEELVETEYQGETIYLFADIFEDTFDGDDDYYDYEYYDEEGGFDGVEGGDNRDSFEGEKKSALAFVGDLAIAGLSEEDVRGVIDVVQGRAPSIVENQRFMELQTLQTEDFLIWGWADLAPAWDAIEEYLQEEDPDEYDEIKRFFDDGRDFGDRITFSLTSRGDGFVIDAAVMRRPGVTEAPRWTPSKTFDSAYAQQVPEDTLLFAAGYDIYNQYWLPVWDSFKDVDLNFSDPYCSGTFGSYYSLYSPASSYDYDFESGPFYEQFVDERGEFDYEAYDEWQDNLEILFTRPDGSFDYKAYEAYYDGVIEEYCADKSETLAQAIEEFEFEAGFDIEDDLLSLMTGEFAVTLDASDFDADTPEIEVLGLIDVTNPDLVAESADKFVAWLEEQDEGWYDAGEESGVHVVANTDEDIEAGWAVDGNTLLIGYPDEHVAKFIADDTGDALADSGDWERTMRLLPVEKTSVVYVNVSRLLDEIGEIEDIEDEFEDATDGEVELHDLDPIRSIGVATSNIEGGYAFRAVVFVK